MPVLRQADRREKNLPADLQAITVTQEILRELWVRGPDRHWYRYLVLKDSLEGLDNDDDDETRRDPDGGGTPPSRPWFTRPKEPLP